MLADQLTMQADLIVRLNKKISLLKSARQADIEFIKGLNKEREGQNQKEKALREKLEIQKTKDQRVK